MTELYSLRTANSKTFDLGGGKKQVEITMHRQHYKDGAEFKEIDTRFVSEVGFGEKVQKADYHLTYKDRVVRFGFATGVYVDYHLPCDLAARDSELTGQIDPYTTLRYLSTPDGVKMEIILSQCPKEPPTYTIPITLTGCELTQDMLFVADGKAVGQIPAPWMVDSPAIGSRESDVIDTTGEVLIEYGRAGITITPDWNWLQGATYPVTIDPTTTIAVGASVDDGYYSSTELADNSNTIYVGYYPDTLRHYHSFFRFLTDIPKGSSIESAKLRIFSWDNGTRNITLRIFTEAADNPDAPEDHEDVMGRVLSADYVDWVPGFVMNFDSVDTSDLSGLVQAIVNRAGWESGNAILFFLKSVETNTTYWRVRAYISTQTYRPRLIIDYTESGGDDATVSAPTASATAEALPPTVTGRRKATAQALTSIAQATALAPSASASSKTTVHAATATATAEMLTPSVQAKRKAIVQAPVASATVEMLAPTVHAARKATVQAPTASATAEMLPPTVTARQGNAVLAPTATATASMLAPAVKASRKATVQAPTATATASALNPAVSGGTGASVHVPTAEATTSMLPPTVTASRKATVQAPTAQATVTMILPVVLAKRHARATAPTMTATASALVPTVRGRNPMNAIKRIDVVFAERHGKSVVAERQGETRFDA